MYVTVNDVMTREVVSVHQDTPFKDIAEALIERGISSVPVVDDAGRVLGVVSEAATCCARRSSASSTTRRATSRR